MDIRAITDWHEDVANIVELVILFLKLGRRAEMSRHGTHLGVGSIILILVFSTRIILEVGLVIVGVAGREEVGNGLLGLQ
jgi:hypothetical protein